MTSAIASRKARENLIRLLFPKEQVASSSGSTSATLSVPLSAVYTDRHSHSQRQTSAKKKARPCVSGSGSGDSQQKRFSYSQLRAVYLQKVHDMHPDKVAHKINVNDNNNNQQSKEMEKSAHLEFIELKNAWEEYHASARIVQSSRRADRADVVVWDEEEEEEDNFTMFGVGCSFADSPEERDRRNEIMEQACRGWFSSGSLTHTEKDRKGSEHHVETLESQDVDHGMTSKNGKVDDVIDDDQRHVSRSKSNIPGHGEVRLSDDAMFATDDEQATQKAEEMGVLQQRKTLVQNASRFRRRR